MNSNKKRNTISISGKEYHIRDIYKLISGELGISERLATQKAGSAMNSTMFIGKESGKILAILDGDAIHIPETMQELNLSRVIDISEKHNLGNLENKIKNDIACGKWCDHNTNECLCDEFTYMNDFFMSDGKYINVFTELGKDACMWLLLAYREHWYDGRERELLLFAMRHNQWIINKVHSMSHIIPHVPRRARTRYANNHIHNHKSKPRINFASTDEHVYNMRI